MMSHARFLQIHSGQTSVAKKVYEAVPILEAWSVGQVNAALQRSGVVIAFRDVAGCLNTLKNSGLINEPKTGEFIREGVRQPKTPKVKEPEMKPEAPRAVITTGQHPITTNPIDKLENLAQRIMQVSQMVKGIADDLSDAAIDIQHQFEGKEEDLKKFKQLQELLKGIGA